ncbi:MAG: hypothetical protein ABJM29_06470 [Rhizobiaceae bacterium]
MTAAHTEMHVVARPLAASPPGIERDETRLLDELLSEDEEDTTKH